MHLRVVPSHGSAACIAIALGAMAMPAPAAAYYAGKTIEFIIGSDVGGYDIYARLLARHLPRFIPGNPAIVPKNQPPRKRKIIHRPNLNSIRRR